MLRTASLLVLLSGCLCLSAYRQKDPRLSDRPFPVNSRVANFFLQDGRPAAPSSAAFEGAAEATDSSVQTRVLMLNYSSFDSDYANMLHRTLQQQLPMCTVTDFWEGTPDDLAAFLANQDVVVISYPSGGDSAILRGYARVLTQFMRQGGGVVFTGTHEFSILQQYGLFDIDSGYYCDNLEIHSDNLQHPVMAGVGENFTLNNFAYPLDISDPAFVTLADIRGYPVLGYKPVGSGKVVYLGLEYFYDEAKTSRILSNTISWLTPVKNAAAAVAPADRAIKHTEEILYAGSNGRGSEINYDLKIYPNPYFSKANLEIELLKNAPVSVDVTDETGRLTASILTRKGLVSGVYHFDLPNLAPGVYFVRCQIGDKTVVKKIVKTSVP